MTQPRSTSQRSGGTVCGEGASYGFGPPGFPLQAAEAWYCGQHRQEGERAWAARYRGGSLGPAVLL